MTKKKFFSTEQSSQEIYSTQNTGSNFDIRSSPFKGRYSFLLSLKKKPSDFLQVVECGN